VVKGFEGREMDGRRDIPIPSRLGDVEEHHKLLQWGLGQSPSHKRFCGVSCAILCDFMHILVHLTATCTWYWEIPTSL